MKKIIVACLALTLMFNCNKNEFTIKGIAKGFTDGTVIQLETIDENGKPIIKNKATIKNEAFTMKGQVMYPEVGFLKFDDSESNLTFMLENSDITVDLIKKNLMVSKVTGSATQDDMDRFQSGFRVIIDSSRRVAMQYRKIDFRTKSKERDSLAQLISAYGEQIIEHPLNFVKENNNSYFSLNLIGLQANKPKFNVKGFVEAYNNLNPSLKENLKAKSIKKTLDSLYTEYKKTEHLEIGRVAPNFEAPTQNGSLLSLNAVKGKVTLIHFWAAWSLPSREENPNIARIYNKYHDQGLEIISVSLDGISNQDNPKAAWLEAIETDQLIWNNVSYLNNAEDPIIKLYNLNGIPSVYILDKDGKIVAKDLRNYTLQSKVEELLKD